MTMEVWNTLPFNVMCLKKFLVVAKKYHLGIFEVPCLEYTVKEGKWEDSTPTVPLLWARVDMVN